MSLTTAQLETEFTAANIGEAPDAATQLLLAAYAQETQEGSITDSAALLDALHIPPPSDGSVGSNTPEDTTDVALAVYQFFTGMAPTVGGLEYLVNGGGNPNDLDSAYYAGFNQANRYYNFAINLITGNAAAAANFAASYGSVTFDQTVATAYESIVGTPNVGSAAAAAAIASIEGQLSYFQAVASEIAPTVNQDLATKAIAIAYILEEAVKADVGYYAYAIDQFDIALATGAPIPGETANGIDLLASYPVETAGQTFTLTPGIDTITPPDTNNNIVVATELTFNSFDSINLGTTTGNTFNWTDSSDPTAVINAVPVAVTVEGIQTAHFASTGALNVNTSSANGWTGLQTLDVATNSGYYGADNVTADPSTVVNVFDALTSDNFTGSGLTVNGGSVVTINEANGNFFTVDAPITVNGGSGTTDVTVNQTETYPGEGDDNGVVINDYFGTITTVTLNGLDGDSSNYYATINGNVLSSLTVDNAVDSPDIFIDDIGGSPAALNLTLNNADLLYVEDEGSNYSTLNVSVGPSGAGVEFDFEGVTQENISGSGALFQYQNSTEMESLEAIVISGAASFTDWTLSPLSHLVAVNAAGTTGTISVAINDTHTTFTGGSGADFVVVHDDATVPITGGSDVSGNEIVFDLPGSDLTVQGSYEHVQNFGILGTYTASGGAYNLEGFLSPTQIANVDVRGAPSSALVFENSASTQTLSVDTSMGDVVGPLGGAVITLDLAGGGSTVLNLNLGTAGTNGIDTSDVAGSLTETTVGSFGVTQAEGPGAVTVGTLFFNPAVQQTTWTDELVVNSAVKNGDDITIKDGGFTLTLTATSNVPSQVATEIANDINAESSALGFTATTSGADVFLTSNTSGTAGNPSGFSAKDTTTAGGLTEDTPSKGANYVPADGYLQVNTTDPGPSLLVIRDGSGNSNILGAVDLTASESTTNIALAIEGVLKADGFTGLLPVGPTLFYTDPDTIGANPGPVTVNSYEYQIDTINLSGTPWAKGDTISETFTSGLGTTATVSVTYSGQSLATATATLASEISAAAPDLMATASGTTITLNEILGSTPFTDQQQTFSASYVVETTPSTADVGNQTILADGYQTVNLDSEGTGAGGTNFVNLDDNALSTLNITGTEALTIQADNGDISVINTAGFLNPFAELDLFGLYGSQSETGLNVTLGNANVEIYGSAATGFTDVFTGGNGYDYIYATTLGGNTEVALGNGTDTVVINTGSSNNVALGNGSGDIVYDYSGGTDTITVGGGGGDYIFAIGSGNFTVNIDPTTTIFGTDNDNVIFLGNGTDSATIGGGGLNNGVFVGSGVETLTFGAHTSTSGVAGLFDFVGLEATGYTSGLLAASFAPPTTASQTSVITTNLDVITGLVAGDVIELPNFDSLHSAGAAGLSGVAGEAVFESGTYNATTHVFDYSAVGTDALLTYDSGGSTFVSVVVVGGASELASATYSTAHPQTWITLG